jgi:hypothetical protein
MSFEMFTAKLREEARLKARLTKLYEYRRLGFRSLQEAAAYEAEKKSKRVWSCACVVLSRHT